MSCSSAGSLLNVLPKPIWYVKVYMYTGMCLYAHVYVYLYISIYIYTCVNCLCCAQLGMTFGYGKRALEHGPRKVRDQAKHELLVGG